MVPHCGQSGYGTLMIVTGTCWLGDFTPRGAPIAQVTPQSGTPCRALTRPLERLPLGRRLVRRDAGLVCRHRSRQQPPPSGHHAPPRADERPTRPRATGSGPTARPSSSRRQNNSPRQRPWPSSAETCPLGLDLRFARFHSQPEETSCVKWSESGFCAPVCDGPSNDQHRGGIEDGRWGRK